MRPPPSLQHMGSPKLESTNQIPQTDGGMDSEGEEDFEPEEGRVVKLRIRAYPGKFRKMEIS